MSGFCGYHDSSPAPDRFPVVERMVAALGRDESCERTLHDVGPLGFAAGAIGAAASPSGATIVHSDDRSLSLWLTGELFPSNAPGSIATPAELLSAYAHEGPACLARLNGWFSGLFIDTRNSKAVLFNDRFGLGRVYFHESSAGIVFASEAKAILAVRPATRSLAPAGLGEWLSCGCVLQNRTLFASIDLLPPGSAWTFRAGGRVTKTTYFKPDVWETQSPLEEDDYYRQLRGLFPRIVRRYFGGSRDVAMSLTGGLDGRMIMAWSPRDPGALPCYTFNGPLRDCADVTLARRIARQCGQSHRTIAMDDRFFAAFPALAERSVFVTDGAMDVTGAAELHVNLLAREIAPVRLTGNYGSETMRSNIAFRPRPFPEALLARELQPHVQSAARTYADEAAGNRLSFIAFKQVPWHHFSRFAVERSLLTIRSPFLDNDLLALFFRAPVAAAADTMLSLRLIADGNPQLGKIPTDRGLVLNPGGVANGTRRFLHEFLARAEYAYDYGMPDWFSRLDRCLSPLQLERLFLGRQKFCHFRSWYRGPLAPFVRDILLDPRSRQRSHVESASLERMVADHIAGRANHTTSIHKLLSLELVHRTLLAP